jgi:hypothetical protein
MYDDVLDRGTEGRELVVGEDDVIELRIRAAL